MEVMHQCRKQTASLTELLPRYLHESCRGVPWCIAGFVHDRNARSLGGARLPSISVMRCTVVAVFRQLPRILHSMVAGYRPLLLHLLPYSEV